MKTWLTLWIWALLGLHSPVVSDDPATTARLVGFAELAGQLGEPGLRLLDARTRGEYEKGHIPGAVWVDVKMAEVLAARPGGLQDKAAWEAWMASLGIGPDTEVVVYDANRQLVAARIWWLLTYLGVERAGLVDGGFLLWEEQGRPVTREVPAVTPRRFAVRFRDDRHADRAEVLEAIRGGQAQVLDARSPAEYAGQTRMAKKAGHIPTACPLEWKQLVDEQGRFLDESKLRAKLSRVGIQANKPVITHCQGGGRSSVEAFALEHLGFEARNYYHGWSDWGNAEETPVTRGDEPGTAEKP